MSRWAGGCGLPLRPGPTLRRHGSDGQPTPAQVGRQFRTSQETMSVSALVDKFDRVPPFFGDFYL